MLLIINKIKRMREKEREKKKKKYEKLQYIGGLVCVTEG